MDRVAHWEAVYRDRQPTELSWYQPRPTRSLALLEAVGVGPATAVLDVGGGGDSTLVDALLERGIGRVAVLDVSAAALERARARLGARAGEVTWIEGDVTRAELPPASYDLWHDRASFHFLTDPDERRRYAALAHATLRTGGHLIVATFAADGPTRCSGLEVARYDAEALARELGEGFELVRSERELHLTPAGREQRFTYAVLRRR